MSKLYLIFGVHNHQPLGNFDEVFEKAYTRCYLPFLEVLSKFSHIKCSVHFSGCLFDWLEEHKKKEVFHLLKDLVGRRQIEFLSGGYYEPILSLIPRRDRVGQIKYMNRFLKDNFSVEPQGIWLTERVWEQNLVSSIKEADINYTLVDDVHFKYAGILKDNFFGYYRTEEDMHSIAVFPISKLLRYNIPFSTIENLRSLFLSLKDDKEDRLITIMDDGEKFGLWPHTYEWVYGKKWLEGFFRFLDESQDWIETVTFSQALERFSPEGLVYLPTASYSEMMEWVLEPEAFGAFREVKERVRNLKGGEVFLRGGYFRNFLRKYPEINHMHKRMLFLSRNLRDGSLSSEDKALRYLWMAQCNCAWWHGIFGGFYLGHLRDEVYQNLLRAETIWERENQLSFSLQEEDFNLDGEKEIFLRNTELNIIVAPHQGGSILEIDAKRWLLNLSNCLSRRPENYHADVGRKRAADFSHNPKSIHDLVKAKEKDLDKYLVYDSYRKLSLIEGFVPKKESLDFLKKYGLRNTLAQWPFRYSISQAENQWRVKLEGAREDIRVEKSINLKREERGAEFSYRFVCGNEQLIRDEFIGIEFNLFIPSLNNSYYSLGGHNFSLFQDCFLSQSNHLDIIDTFRKFNVRFFFEKAGVAVFPIFSVSSSEGGFEKNLQHLCVVFLVDLAFARDFRLAFSIESWEEREK